jgi:hypothetical protein
VYVRPADAQHPIDTADPPGSTINPSMIVFTTSPTHTLVSPRPGAAGVRSKLPSKAMTAGSCRWAPRSEARERAPLPDAGGALLDLSLS